MIGKNILTDNPTSLCFQTPVFYRLFDNTQHSRNLEIGQGNFHIEKFVFEAFSNLERFPRDVFLTTRVVQCSTIKSQQL